MKKALISGITGQDGSYLAEFLLEQGYEVHGIVRRSSSFNTGRIDHLYQDPHEKDARLFLHYGDFLDERSLESVVSLARPNEVYHLAAQSHVRVSFDHPVYTADVTALGVLRMLEAIRAADRPIKFYQASSSEMFGSSPPPQSESTPFHPRSPYGCSKVYAFYQVMNYREAYDLFAVNGILFNHESPRRGETFVTRKITRAAARIKELDLDWEEYVKQDARYLRPSEVNHLRGDASKALRKMEWEPQVDLRGLIRLMVQADLELAESEKLLRDAGHSQPARH